MESKRYLRATCLMALPVIFFSAPLSAIENDEPKSIQLSRYSSLDIDSIKVRRNIMVSVVDEHFSDEIQTVGDAIVHLVTKYGYRVGRADPEDESQYYLFNLPLPETHREFSPFPLISALALLGGEGFGLVVNPVRREVTYQLEAAYQGSLSDDEVQAAKSAWLTRYPEKSSDLHDNTIACQETRLRSYGPVAAGDSLLTVSRSFNRDGLTDAQVMMSIFDHNPSSFLHNNINYLLEGTTLTIPSKEVMQAMPHDFAKERVIQHARAWKDKPSK